MIRSATFLLAVLTAWPAIADTHVVGTLRDALNQPVTGAAVLSWRAFTTADGKILFPSASTRLPIDAGIFDARIEPGLYVLEYASAAGAGKTTLYLAVPASGVDVQLTACILSDTTKLDPLQLGPGAATAGQVLTWDGSHWTPAAVGALNYAPISYTAAIAAQTSVTVPAATHHLGSAAITATCYDGASHELVEADKTVVDPSTFAVTLTFTVAFSGRCILR